MKQQKDEQDEQLRNVHEELTQEINDVAQPFTLPEGSAGKGAGVAGLSIDAVAAASQRATKKIERNIDNLKKKVLPEAMKTLENTLD